MSRAGIWGRLFAAHRRRFGASRVAAGLRMQLEVWRLELEDLEFSFLLHLELV